MVIDVVDAGQDRGGGHRAGRAGHLQLAASGRRALLTDGLAAAEGGGEPPGRWWGPVLGAELLTAEPHATAERRREIRLEAVSRARQNPLYFDLTISLSKSISVFHASLGENARLAWQAGDRDGEAFWADLVGEVDQMIWQAVYAWVRLFPARGGVHPHAAGAKLILAGDLGQLQAVASGGGMTRLANALGFAQLAEPVRFAEPWERTASLRLRAGDVSVLRVYDQHGRIMGGLIVWVQACFAVAFRDRAGWAP